MVQLVQVVAFANKDQGFSKKIKMKNWKNKQTNKVYKVQKRLQIIPYPKVKSRN